MFEPELKRSFYAACHNYVPKKGWRHKGLQQKNGPQSERFSAAIPIGTQCVLS